MTTSNPTKEEKLMREAARIVVAKALEGKKPRIIAREFYDITRSLVLTDEELERFLEYLQTPLGTESFKKTVRLEVWRAGYRPRGWKG